MGNSLSALRRSKPVHIPDYSSQANAAPRIAAPAQSNNLLVSAPPLKRRKTIDDTPQATPSITILPAILAPAQSITLRSNTPETATPTLSSALPVSTPPVKPSTAIDTTQPTTPATTTVLTTFSPTPSVTLPSKTRSTHSEDRTNTAWLTTTLQAPITTLTPNDPQYTVFISHAGEDKATIAIPLREKLRGRGITAFVDEVDLSPGMDSKKAMIDAMETAEVGAIILSPEFVAREWPMRELMCFLRRREECAAHGRTAPIIIPCFYRLRIDELYAEPRLDRKDKDGNLLYETARFEERQRSGEAGANIACIKAALKSIHGLMGVRNDWEATNESSFLVNKRREMLLQELSGSVEKAVLRAAVNPGPACQSVNDGISQAPVDRFRKFFPPLSSGVRAVLDFASKDESGNPMTPEGWVKHHLLEQGSGSANVVSIRGIGGVGKSTIMRALSVDCEIQQRFDDGMHIITLGKDASSATLFRQICQVLKDSGAEKTSESIRMQSDIDEALDSFERWFNGRRCAFLIDDVWVHRVGLELMSRLCKVGNGVSGSCVVLTTREHEAAAIAPRQKTVRSEPRVTRGRNARRILFFHADLKDTDDYAAAVEDSINGILDICDGLPVSLAAAGKNVKMVSMDMPNEEGAWKQYLSEVVTCRERLIHENVEGYGNLFATFATSISILDQQPRQDVLGFASRLSFAEMCRRLCVLRKQAAVPSRMLKHLWEAESEERANRIARKFIEAGLASRKFVHAGEECLSYLALHDSVHDFAVAEAERHGDRKEAHDFLLKGYSSCEAEICYEVKGTLRWWSPRLEGDGYIRGNVCRHLLGAGRDGELVALLLSPLWAKRQLEVNDFLFLEEDFKLGITAVQEGMRDASDAERYDLGRALRLLSEALSLSSGFISRNLAEMWFQLPGRLIRYSKSCRALREYLGRIEREGERPMVICKNKFLTDPGGATVKLHFVGVEVLCVVVFKDGKDVACGLVDGRILIMNVNRGEVTKEWTAHSDAVKVISMGRDGTRLVSGSLYGVPKVWDVESCRCVAVFGDHADAVTCIAMMKDERRVVSGSKDGTARVWDIETGQEVSTPLTCHWGVACVAVLGDGEVVVTGGCNYEIRLWDVSSGEELDDTFDGKPDSIMRIAVTPDGRRFVSVSHENGTNVFRVWDAESRHQIGSSFKGHARLVSCVAVSRDGRRAVSGSLDTTIRVWCLDNGTESCDPLTGHTSEVTRVAFLAGGDRIISSSRDGTVRVWDLRRKTMEGVINRHSSAVEAVSFSLDGEFVLSADYGKLRIWNATSGEEVENPLPVHPWGIRDVTLTPNGVLASVYDDKKVRVWDLKFSKLLHTLTGHTNSIISVAVTPQGDRLVTGSDDNTVRIWDLAAMDCSHVVLEGHTAGVAKVFITDDGLRIVSMDWDHHIFIWELDTKKVVKRFRGIDARLLSRREVLSLAAGTAVDDNMKLSFVNREIVYGEGLDATVLATLESDIHRWAVSPDKKMICVGLQDGHVGLMKLER